MMPDIGLLYEAWIQFFDEMGLPPIPEGTKTEDTIPMLIRNFKMLNDRLVKMEKRIRELEDGKST